MTYVGGSYGGGGYSGGYNGSYNNGYNNSYDNKYGSWNNSFKAKEVEVYVDAKINEDNPSLESLT